MNINEKILCDIMFCPECGKSVNNNQKFCDSCGASLERNNPIQNNFQEVKRHSHRVHMKACVNCGTFNPENQIICANCGKNVNYKETYSNTSNNDSNWIYGCCCLLIILIVIFALI